MPYGLLIDLLNFFLIFFEFGYYIIICVLVLYLLVLHIKVEKKLYCIYRKNDVSNLGTYHNIVK